MVAVCYAMRAVGFYQYRVGLSGLDNVTERMHFIVIGVAAILIYEDCIVAA